MNGKGLFEQLGAGKVIKYVRTGGITKMHIFLSIGYIFEILIPGSYFVCETEEDALESIEHFKFLRKYNLI